MLFVGCVLPTLLATSTLLDQVFAARSATNSVLLSNVKTLTLRKDAKTSHRRVSAIPQLKCIGGNARGLYEVDVMRCQNQGSDYDDDNIQWTCTASLPPQFKLGSTDVICEGYSSPTDPYILKGSCGVEYRLALTPEGQKDYGRGGSANLFDDFKPRGYINWMSVLFWGLFLGVAGWMVYAIFFSPTRRLDPGASGRDQPWGWGGSGGGGGGGGGGAGGDGGDDAPPPYTTYPQQPRGKAAPATSSQTGQQAQGWRPGFWTGMLGGAAGAYLARNAGNGASRTQQQQQQQQQQQRYGGGGDGEFNGGWNTDNGGASSSRWDGGSTRNGGNFGSGGGGGFTFGSSGSTSSSRHESTGFGGTSRR